LTKRAPVAAPRSLLARSLPPGVAVAPLAHVLIERTSVAMPRPVHAERTAIVVEDDPRLLEAMTRWFESQYFRVLSARHYDAAIAHLAKLQAHVVCVDIGLPSKSGYEVCEYIRGPLGLSGLPIIVTSERGHAEDRAHAEEAGANAFLQKPFSLKQLTSSVESLLDFAPSGLSSKGDLARLPPRSASTRPRARADASLMPSPVMATRRPFGRSTASAWSASDLTPTLFALPSR
jgi:CheY-like chemotaxis protein